MSICTYDNPSTMCREAWQDGRLVAHITMSQMYQKGFNGSPRMFFGLNTGRDFTPGRVVGETSAMKITKGD